MKNHKKPWAGRFTEATDQAVERFTASVDFDRRLYKQDIAASIAHAKMLTHVGVLSDQDCDAIVAGLGQIESEIESGEFAWRVELEDVHMNIEARLVERIGEAGKKLHTGRSRNDQIATDLRLYLREAIDNVCRALRGLESSIVDVAEREHESPLPGFTHLQVAQPVTLGHHLLAWFEMLERDRERMTECRARVDIMPLGSAALAGTSFPIDRAYTAKLLGFSAVALNSLDAVSDRDFAIEFVADAAMVMVHLSRIAEELILWSSAQFGFIELSDAYCTGSSIMPQKKNPDVPELIRGKTGRVYGHLLSLFTIMKAQPLAYNRDNQEDKEPVFDTVDTLVNCLEALTGVVASMQVRRDTMLRAAEGSFSTATDLADYLVRKGVPFRDAHGAAGKAVRRAIDSGKSLAQMELGELQAIHSQIEADVYQFLSLEGSLRSRSHIGGTAPERVLAAVKEARRRLGNL